MTAVQRSVLVGVTFLASALVGCGGGEGPATGDEVASLDDASPDATTDGSTPASAPVDIEDAMLAYTECMREQGIDLPDPRMTAEGGVAIELEGGDLDGREMEAAEAECGPLMRDAMGDIEIDPEQQAEMEAQMLEFASCMREHGIDMPDPQFGADGSVRVQSMSTDPGAERDSDEFRAASDECGQDGMLMAGPPAEATTSGGDG